MKIAGYAGKDEITLGGKKIKIKFLLEDQKKKFSWKVKSAFYRSIPQRFFLKISERDFKKKKILKQFK